MRRQVLREIADWFSYILFGFFAIVFISSCERIGCKIDIDLRNVPSDSLSSTEKDTLVFPKGAPVDLDQSFDTLDTEVDTDRMLFLERNSTN